MEMHAKGTFEVKTTPQEQSAGLIDGLPNGRFGLEKVFSGDLAGKALGTMLSVGTPKIGTAGAYVALDQFVGTLNGRHGGFVLVHRGIMTKAGKTDLDVGIVTDSGVGDLTGIAGTLKIDIRDAKHFYDLTYTLP